MPKTEKKDCVVVDRFATGRENEQALVEILVTDIMPALQQQRGFLSTRLHRSMDGTRIVQVTAWQSVNDHFACMKSAQMAAVGSRLVDFLESGRAEMEVHPCNVIFAASAK